MIFSLILSCLLHPLHVSVTEITFDPKDKELEITSRIFIDELEEAIQEELKRPSLDIFNPGKDVTTDQLVSNYLASRLLLKADGKEMKVKYLGHEVEGDALIAYAYAPGVKKLKAIEVTNSTITELYDDQSNLVHVTVGTKTKSLRLMRNEVMGKLTFAE
jgi:hypothetical protein